MPTVTPECRDDAAMVLSELLSHAIQHAEPLPGGQVLVSWGVRERTVRISVTGARGPTEPRMVNGPVIAPSGRGLRIVHALVDRLWRDVSVSTSTVHAVVLCSAADAATGP